MAWIVGVDEEGYGPNLGPFVMTAVAFQVPGSDAHVDLWGLLNAAVRRPEEPDDGRIAIGGRRVDRLSSAQRTLVRRNRIGFVFLFRMEIDPLQPANAQRTCSILRTRNLRPTYRLARRR